MSYRSDSDAPASIELKQSVLLIIVSKAHTALA